MIAKSRNNCVICNSDNIQFLYEKIKYPITFSPPENNYENDIFINQIFLECKICGCVQLKDLIDPKILYDSSHNLTYDTPTWKNHHNYFSQFVYNNYKNDNIIEIGGVLSDLYFLCKEKKIKYTCIDMCEQINKIDGVTYCVGNCENYEFEQNVTIVMSHVFEHLYDPTKFIKNISKLKILNIFISIPNMKSLLEKNDMISVHNEHTYYIDQYLCKYIFSNYGYNLVNKEKFLTHSLFLHFQLSDNINKEKLQYRPEISQKIYTLFSEKSIYLSKILIKPNSFITPGGHFGQMVYTFSKPENIIGFLDNDLSKIGKRVYGTPFKVFKFDILKKYDNINIYIYAGPYTNELIKQINSYNKNIIINII